MSNLVKRTLSAIILAPIFLYIIYKGGYVFFFTTLALFVGMFYEWISVTSKAKHRIYWAIIGFIYLGISFMTMLFLERLRFEQGYFGLENFPSVLIELLILVWITDVFAYFFGRAIGGPKLAPKISPNKTWAGAIGAVIGCVSFYFIINYRSDFGAANISDKSFYRGLMIFVAIPVISQIGDLFESYIKRRFGVKDSGNIIPGHGGLLDRFDGLIMVLFCYGIFVYVSAYQKVAAEMGL